MSNEESEQTLIPKDADEQWRKVVHGEIEPVEDNEAHVDAAVIRDYLILRDEAIAVQSVPETDPLNEISKEDARIIYLNAKQEINLRGKNTWVESFKTYGIPALIGGLTVAVLFLGLQPKGTTLNEPKITVDEDLNYSDYKILKSGEMPGPFPNMLLIGGGSISIGCVMGWDDVPGGCRPTEFPPFTANVKTFEISQHEVTVGQFAKFVESTGYVSDAEKEGEGCVHKDVNAAGQPFVMNSALNWRSPGFEQNESYPVTCVSWHDAKSYVDWLASETKTAYRLPTETEWEYAARGGKSTAYYWGSAASHDQANYGGVGGKDEWEFASPVGRFPANKFSVQDTSGNLWEWVQDCWHKTHDNAPADGSAWVQNCDLTGTRVRRGGAWDANVNGIRSAIRSAGAEHDRSNLYGFRVARNWQKSKK